MMSRKAGWKTVQIREVYQGLYDGPHATPKPSKSGPVFLGIKNVTDDGQLDLSDIRSIAEDDFSAWTRRVEPRAGDLVFTYEATLNRYAIIPDGFRGCLGRRMALIRPNTQKIDVRFLLYYFFTDAWRNVIRENTLSGSTVDRIPLTKFPYFPVCLPSLSVQRRVADALAVYDELIENNQRRIRIMEEMARSLYREWFVHFRFPGQSRRGKLVPSSEDLPRNWSVTNLGSLVSVITKGTTPTTLGKAFTDSGVNFLKVESITESGAIIPSKLAHIDSETNEMLKRSQLLHGDILFSIAGAIGRTALMPRRFLPANTNQALAIIRASDATFVHYLVQVLRSPEFLNFSKGHIVQTAQANVSLSVLRAAPITLPATELLLKFSQAVEPLYRSLDCLTTQNDNLRETRDLLLPRLLSGQIKLEAN